MDPSDRQLLEQFATRKQEQAFAALLERHGPMVFGLCRRVLHHHPDAEDAFQATFLVLAHKAASIRRRDSVAGWLYGVAYRLARRLKTQSAARRQKERLWAEASATPSAGQRLATDLISTVIWRELRPVLDEELQRLPEKYRAPLLLCYFEGKTHEEAATALGWSKGSMSRRMDKARALLRARLCRRGITLSTGLLFGVLGQHVATSAAPAAVSAATVKAALLLTAGRAAVAGLISTQVALLTEGVLKAMLLSKLKVALVAVVALGLVGAGAGVLGQRIGSGESAQAQADPPPARPQADKAAPPPVVDKADPPPALGIVPPPKDQADPFPPNPIPQQLRTKPQQLRWLLDQPTDKLKAGIDPGTPLRDALDTISKLHHVTIRANESSFDMYERGIVDKLTVQLLPTRGLSLRTVLRDMLSRLQGPVEVQATFLVRGDLIEVVTFQKATPESLLRELVTVTFRNRPLESALEELVDLTGANILVDPRIKESAKASVNAVFQHVPLDTAVRLLCDMADVQSITLDNVLYVTTPENAKRMMEILEKEEQKLMEKNLGPKTPPFAAPGSPGV